MLACLLDCFLVTLPSSVAFTPFLFVHPGLLLALILMLVFVLLFCILYFVYVVVFDGFRGRPLGKAFLGIEIVRAEDGGVPGPGRAALRALAFLFVDMLVGVFVMLISPERQQPGDMVANTLVVRKVNS